MQADEAVAQVITMAEQYSGPIPHPRHLGEIEQIAPDAAGKLIGMAEAEQRHWHGIERTQVAYAFTGLVLGFLALLACVGGGRAARHA